MTVYCKFNGKVILFIKIAKYIIKRHLGRRYKIINRVENILSSKG